LLRFLAVNIPCRLILAALLGAGLAACTKPEAPAKTGAPVAQHEHRPPHGGTPVVLGAEVYHLELVLDPVQGTLSAYVLDGEMENFIRIAAPSLEIVATVDGVQQKLFLSAISNMATGEKIGDTAMFETSADWLKTTKTFDAVLTSIEVKGTTFTGVAFNFPKGNDKD
jgi:hypothetical protein